MIRKSILQEEFVSIFAEAFASRKHLSGNFFKTYEASLQTAVYPAGVLNNFLQDTSAQQVHQELLKPELNYLPRTSDLYDFHQTEGLEMLSSSEFPAIHALVREIYSPVFTSIMEKIVQRPLNAGKMTITAQRYRRGDFLLCHDDRLESRRVAFILYFPSPEASDAPDLEGGSLLLMRSDETGRPTPENFDQLTPIYNRAVFFEVTRSSFHQVEQIYSDGTPRYSIICWFHDAASEFKAISPTHLPCKTTSLLSGDCINELLLDFAKMGKEIMRPYGHCRCLSLASYCDDEPAWIKSLLHPSIRTRLQSLTGLQLDWGSRPVAWLVRRAEKDSFFRGKLMRDFQTDVDYNYKARSNKKTVSLFVNIFIGVDTNGQASYSRTRISKNNVRIRKYSKKYAAICLVQCKFTIK